MNVALEFVALSQDELKSRLDGGTLTVYSVARPEGADKPVERSEALVTFTFAKPAFGPVADGFETPRFVTHPVAAAHVGTPGFARARAADGSVVADFSAGPGHREIKFSEASFSAGAPVKIVAFSIASPSLGRSVPSISTLGRARVSRCREPERPPASVTEQGIGPWRRR